jgi:hypothetical protein
MQMTTARSTLKKTGWCFWKPAPSRAITSKKPLTWWLQVGPVLCRNREEAKIARRREQEGEERAKEIGIASDEVDPGGR